MNQSYRVTLQLTNSGAPKVLGTVIRVWTRLAWGTSSVGRSLAHLRRFGKSCPCRSVTRIDYCCPLLFLRLWVPLCVCERVGPNFGEWVQFPGRDEFLGEGEGLALVGEASGLAPSCVMEGPGREDHPQDQPRRSGGQAAAVQERHRQRQSLSVRFGGVQFRLQLRQARRGFGVVRAWADAGTI